MKKLFALLIVLALLMCTVQYLTEEKVNASDEGDPSAKLTTMLKEKIDSSKDDELIDVYLFLGDVEEEEAMNTFASEYPDEYAIYMREKESDYEFPVYNADLSLKDPEESNMPVMSEDESELLQKAIESKRTVYRNLYKEANNDFLEKYSKYIERTSFVSEYSPMIIASMYKDDIMNLIKNNDVSWMDLFTETEIIDELALANEITRADYVRDTGGNDGTGVKIGQIEGNVPDVSNSDLVGQTITIKSGSAASSQHATLVAQVLIGKSNGIAPAAHLYAASCGGAVSFYTSVEWLISQGVNVINMSCGYGGTATYDDMSKWVDHVAITHDVHFVKSAGNEGENTGYITSPGMAYNAITVGSYNDGNTLSHSNDLISTFSSYLEGNETVRAEKPNIIAPGDLINITGIGNVSGTSVSAPQVTAIIAQLCSYNSGFKIKQSAVSAMLMASATRKLPGHTGGNGSEGESFNSSEKLSNTYQIGKKEGAGKVDSRWLRGIAIRWTFWSHTINSSDFPFEKNVTIDASGTALTRIAIFWLKRNSISGTGHTPGTVNQISFSNLNLQVFDPNGNSVGTSSTNNANFEIVQFVPTVSGQYKIKITRQSGTADKEIIGIALW